MTSFLKSRKSLLLACSRCSDRNPKKYQVYINEIMTETMNIDKELNINNDDIDDNHKEVKLVQISETNKKRSINAISGPESYISHNNEDIGENIGSTSLSWAITTQLETNEGIDGDIALNGITNSKKVKK